MPIEQGTYDWFLRNAQAILPPSAGDSRIIQIGLEQEDLTRYGDRLNDVDLIRLLQRLNQAGAIAIGVLLDRSQPIVLGRVIAKNPQSSQLTPFENYLKHHPNTIATCQYPERSDDGWVPGAVGPRVDQPLNQLGYQNIFSDHDGIARRYLLIRGRDVGYRTDRCSQDASYAFGMQLASRFLKFHNLKIESVSEWNLKIASPATKQSPLIIKRLRDFSGFYQDYKTPNSGWKVPLTYRYLGVGGSHNSDRFSVTQIMDPSQSLSQIVAGKIVIIHNSEADKERRSRMKTPFGLATTSDIHAHFISQVLDAALKQQRFSMLFLPIALEATMVLIVAALIGAWTAKTRSRSQRWIVMGSGILGLVTVGQVGILMGISLPVSPAIGAATITVFLTPLIMRKLTTLKQAKIDLS
jgi:CHASE2 domain-containing sensor protein